MKTETSRRSFLKKAAYAAPAVIALGTLTAPVSAHASIISVNNDTRGPFGQLNINTSGKYDNVADQFSEMKSTTTIVRTGKEISSHTYTEQEIGFFSNLWRKLFKV